MKMRLLCILVLIVFAMGCKDEKKEKDDDDKGSTEQSTEGGEATGGNATGGEATGGDASCSAVYDKLASVMKGAGAPAEAIAGELGEKGKFVADCEKESTAEQRNCIIKADGMEAVGACMAAESGKTGVE